MRRIRGGEISMVFQEPMTSLSPVHTIGSQIIEAITLHQDVTPAEARRQAIDMLAKVGMPQPERTIDRYPYQLSRRYAPARHDRHGALLPAQPADRR